MGVSSTSPWQESIGWCHSLCPLIPHSTPPNPNPKPNKQQEVDLLTSLLLLCVPAKQVPVTLSVLNLSFLGHLRFHEILVLVGGPFPAGYGRDVRRVGGKSVTGLETKPMDSSPSFPTGQLRGPQKVVQIHWASVSSSALKNGAAVFV